MKKKLTEEEKQRIFEMWQDRTPTKVIALEIGKTYQCIYSYLRSRYLVG